MPKKRTVRDEASDAAKRGDAEAALEANKPRKRESAFADKAREMPQGELMKGIQDVAISTRIAIDHAVKALDYAEVTIKESDAANQVGKMTRETKRRAKEIKKAEVKLTKAVDMMKKARTDLETTLRGTSK